MVTVLLVFLSMGILYLQVSLLSRGDLIARTSLRLLMELYQPLLIMRLLFLLAAAVYFGIAIYRLSRSKLTSQSLIMPVYLSCLLILVGEIIGRFLFYATHIRVGI